MHVQITRYDPELRDSNGHYPIDDWTSVSDIGKANGPTKQEYLETEDAYFLTLTSILRSLGVISLKVGELSEHVLEEELRSGNELERESTAWCAKNLPLSQVLVSDLRPLFAALMREIVWCELYCKGLISISFSHDLYLIVKSKEALTWTSFEGIWVEEW